MFDDHYDTIAFMDFIRYAVCVAKRVVRRVVRRNPDKHHETHIPLVVDHAVVEVVTHMLTNLCPDRQAECLCHHWGMMDTQTVELAEYKQCRSLTAEETAAFAIKAGISVASIHHAEMSVINKYVVRISPSASCSVSIDKHSSLCSDSCNS
jgi:hypothetical protein